MKRYQIYLNPQSVSTLDEFGKDINISRSKLIRETMDRVADQIIAIFASEKKHKKRYLDELCGFVDIKTKEKTNFAENIDEIYLTD